MLDKRIPKQLLYCQLIEEKTSSGRPNKRLLDSLKASLKDFHNDLGIQGKGQTYLAQPHQIWC